MFYMTPASRYITSASRYHPRYQSRSSMYIRGLIPRNFAELAEAGQIAATPQYMQCTITTLLHQTKRKNPSGRKGFSGYFELSISSN